jgi:hypothetical protein
MRLLRQHGGSAPAAFQEVPHMYMLVRPRQFGDSVLRRYPDAPGDADPSVRAEYAKRL